MEFCPSCGKKLKPGVRFCVSCGTPLPLEKEIQVFDSTRSHAKAGKPLHPVSEIYHPGFKRSGYAQIACNLAGYIFSSASVIFDKWLLSRVINIILKTKTEWVNVLNEDPDNTKTWSYAWILLLIPTVSNFIAYGFIGVNLAGLKFRSPAIGIQQGLMTFVGGILTVYVTALVIDALAASFDSEKNLGRSYQLVIYSMTPFWISGVLFLIPGFQPVVYLIGLSVFYLLYKGMPVLMKTPEKKTAGYLIVSIIVLIISQIILSFIIGFILSVFFVVKVNEFSLLI